MHRVTAAFRAELVPGILCRETVPNVYLPMKDEERRLELKMGRFDVMIELTRFDERGHGRIGGAMARESTGICLLVTGTEQQVPSDEAEEADRRDYVVRRRQEYSIVAERILARLVRYFRFTLGNPLIQPYTHGLQAGMLNPVWTDESGRRIWDRVMTHAGLLTPSLHLYPKCRVRAYEEGDRVSLLLALTVESPISFRDELLAEARDAIALGHVRRGVLELAIACEVGVKHFYFEPATNADSAYSYLEDKGRINARVLEFLDAIALRTFGRSLRIDKPVSYREVDFLFRCRNKVAHRGVATFRDDRGIELTANVDRLSEWWAAVSDALDWLEDVARSA
ncbi:MAG: hypothetical protein QOK37_4378 [Thermoanaerobaculia bacterium]|jgi:hypothetical protein|nr:hypothetical protein [Thermoanaerobaculia bacterium]